MFVKKVSDDKAAETVAAAAEVMKRGGIIAFPTETYYGLGAAYNNPAALEKLYSLKRRPKEKPLPLIAGSIEALALVAELPDRMTALVIERFWPGPLTLLLPAREGLSPLLTAGTASVAVRIPGPSFALDLARYLNCPVTATSANISGKPAADSADSVIAYFNGELDLLIDGGRTPGGAPSTIISISGGKINPLRIGQIPLGAILEAAEAGHRGCD
jgi:L-threonylcarbamoyladenylate synthase